FASSNAKTPHLRSQGIRIHVEETRGSVRPFHAAVCFLQRDLDVPANGVVQRRQTVGLVARNQRVSVLIRRIDRPLATGGGQSEGLGDLQPLAVAQDGGPI